MKMKPPARAGALRRTGRTDSDGHAQSLLPGAEPRQRRRRRSSSSRSTGSSRSVTMDDAAGHRDQHRSGRGLDDREPFRRSPRFPHSPDPFPGDGDQRSAGPNPELQDTIIDPQLVRQRPISQREGAHGFPRSEHCRDVRVSLPHSRSRGWWHDGEDTGESIELASSHGRASWLGASAARIISAAFCCAIIHAAFILMALWARRHLGRNWSAGVRIGVDHKLIRTGPYSGKQFAQGEDLNLRPPAVASDGPRS